YPRTQHASGVARLEVLLGGGAKTVLSEEIYWEQLPSFLVEWETTSAFDVELAAPPRDRARAFTPAPELPVKLASGYSLRGPAPRTAFVRPKPGSPTIVPFRIVVRVGDKEATATGTIFSTHWTTRFWAWTKDPRTDRAAYDALVATPPLVTQETDALDFATS